MEQPLFSTAAEFHSNYRLASRLENPVSPRLRFTSAEYPPSGSRRCLRSPSSLRAIDLRTILLASIGLLLWCTPCLATAISFEDMAAGYSEILFDSRPPPVPRERLIKRAGTDSTSTKARATTTVTATASSTSETSSALPSPFDSSLGNNFTQSSCPTFFQSFLSNSTFNDCIPLSLLLQTSNSFFTVEQSPVRLAQTLDATCAVNLTVCSTLMASLAREIQMDSNCGADLEAQNPTVMQAYSGLSAYQAMYHAGCLQDRDTGSYCFLDAVTNASSPTSSYIYYLALGVALPSSANPTCSSCLQDTMALFGGAASNKSQPVAHVYVDAATLLDAQCGAGFVNTTISGVSSSSSSSAGGSTSAAAARALMLGCGLGDGGGLGGLGVVALAAVVSLLLI